MRVGVIGLGAMGWNHARVCHDLGILGAMADSSADLRHRAERQFVAPAVATTRALLSAAVDAVIIATPTSTHAQLAKEALEAGKHVLVEKPMSSSPDEAQEMIAAARQAGKVLAVGHIERHNPVVRYALQQKGNGRLGELLTVSTRRLSSMPSRIRDVGCILDIGIHDIDFACAMASGPPLAIYAQTGSHQAKPHEDHAFIQIGFEGGMTASIETNWMTPMRIRRASLTFTGAAVELDFVDQRAVISTSHPLEPGSTDRSSIPTEYSNQVLSLRRQEPLRLEIEDFVGAIRGNRPPGVTGEDGLRALLVASAALESAATGRAVSLP